MITRVKTLLLFFLIGFFGISFIIDSQEIIYMKSITFFIGVCIVGIIQLGESIKDILE